VLLATLALVLVVLTLVLVLVAVIPALLLRLLVRWLALALALALVEVPPSSHHQSPHLHAEGGTCLRRAPQFSPPLWFRDSCQHPPTRRPRPLRLHHHRRGACCVAFFHARSHTWDVPRQPTVARVGAATA